MYSLVVKEEEYAVPSVSKKRTATGPAPKPKVKRSVELFASSTSNNKDAVASKVAASKTLKAATTLRIGKTVSFILVKFLVMLILIQAILFFKVET